MIAIICAMAEERDALLKMMKDARVIKGKKLLYHGSFLDNEYYKGNIEGKEVVLSRCVVGQVYASLCTSLLIEKFKPELVINLGCAGSLNENVHVGSIVVADKAAAWRLDVPGWKRNFDSQYSVVGCDEKAAAIASKIKGLGHVSVGGIVSADEFVYKKGQIKEIRRFYPEALCAEMEGFAIAAVCYAYQVPSSIIRSISDETLVSGNYKQFEFNLNAVCDAAAKLCSEIIKRY